MIRAPIEQFAWLLSPAGAGRIRSEEELSTVLALISRCWRVAVPVHTKIERHLHPALRTHALMRRIRDFALGVAVHNRVQNRLALRVAAAYGKAGIPFVFLKSGATRFAVYDNPLHRSGCDLDVGVLRGDIARADAVARELGFAPAIWSGVTERFYAASPDAVAGAPSEHYELTFRVREQAVRGLDAASEEAIRREPMNERLWREESGALICSTALDIHFAASQDIQLDEALEHARMVRHDGQRLPIPPLGWVTFHAIFKLYWEGVHAYGRGAYQFADLCRLVPRLSPGEMRRLERLLEEARLVAGAYYVLRRLPSLGVPLPPRLAKLVERAEQPSSGADPIALNDLGDVWAKVWGRR